MKILVTGAAAHLARPLLPRLLDDPRVASVTGVDLRPSGFCHPRYRELHLDIRDPALAEHLRGVDAVVHLAFVVLRSALGRHRRDRALIYDINVNGSIHVFAQAAAAGVRHIVHLSSAAVYGAWPDNPPLMDETQPLRAMPGFAYAEDKIAVERWLDAFVTTHPALRVVRLRPHVIIGPQCQPMLRFLLAQPFYPALPVPHPLCQCVWEDDVAEAIIAAVFSPARGCYNLGAQPALPFRDMLRASGRRVMPVPFRLARIAQHLLWHVAGIGEEPGWLDGMRYSLAVDSTKALAELGWRPTISTIDCVRRLCGGAHGRGNTVSQTEGVR